MRNSAACSTEILTYENYRKILESFLLIFTLYLSISNDDETVLGTREDDVQSTRVVEEPDARRLVRANARHDYEVFFATLENNKLEN